VVEDIAAMKKAFEEACKSKGLNPIRKSS